MSDALTAELADLAARGKHYAAEPYRAGLLSPSAYLGFGRNRSWWLARLAEPEDAS